MELASHVRDNQADTIVVSGLKDPQVAQNDVMHCICIRPCPGTQKLAMRQVKCGFGTSNDTLT